MGKEFDELKATLLNAPDKELDASMKPLIEKWSNPPKPIELLEVIDKCIFGSLSSGFVLRILQVIYDVECANNNTTHEEVVKGATWRK